MTQNDKEDSFLHFLDRKNFSHICITTFQMYKDVTVVNKIIKYSLKNFITVTITIFHYGFS